MKVTQYCLFMCIGRTATQTEMKSEAVHPAQWTLPPLLESMSPWMLRCCCGQMCRSSAGARLVYLPAQRVFILEYFAPKSLAAVREASSSAHADKDVPNTTILRVVTLFFEEKFNAKCCRNILNQFIPLLKN
jgi:hypothetical protein